MAPLYPLAPCHASKGYHWGQDNPTMTRLEDVGMSYHNKATRSRVQLEKMDRYHELDPRVSFMSVFPVSMLELCKMSKRLLTPIIGLHFVEARPPPLFDMCFEVRRYMCDSQQ